MELLVFKNSTKYGYIDNNKVVISAKYDEAHDFIEETAAIVKFNGKYGVINSSDDIIIDFSYTNIKEHHLFF